MSAYVDCAKYKAFNVSNADNQEITTAGKAGILYSVVIRTGDGTYCNLQFRNGGLTGDILLIVSDLAPATKSSNYNSNRGLLFSTDIYMEVDTDSAGVRVLVEYDQIGK